MKRVLCLLLFFLLLPTPLFAEGPLSGGTRIYIDGAAVGPFTVTSFAAPNPPVTTDRLWVTVQLRDKAKAVDDARVWVTVTPLDGGAPQRMEARHDLAAQPFDYTAALSVPASGGYTVQVETEHPRGGGTTAYQVNVSEPLTRYIFLFVGIPFLLLALWLIRRFGGRLPDGARVLAGDDDPLRSKEALHK